MGQNGPDWYLDIQVDGDPALLRSLVAGLDLPGLRHYRAMHQPGCITGAVGCFDWYFDRDHYDALVDVLSGQQSQAVWLFHWLAIEADQLRFSRGYAYENERAIASEQHVLQTLLQQPQLPIRQWRIYAGGAGYSFVTIATGDTSSSLAQYLSPL